MTLLFILSLTSSNDSQPWILKGLHTWLMLFYHGCYSKADIQSLIIAGYSSGIGLTLNERDV